MNHYPTPILARMPGPRTTWLVVKWLAIPLGILAWLLLYSSDPEAHADIPDQNDYLRVAHGWFPGQTDDYLTRLAMSTCRALHPDGSNDHPTQAREQHVAEILEQGDMSDMTAANFITLVETDLCP